VDELELEPIDIDDEVPEPELVVECDLLDVHADAVSVSATSAVPIFTGVVRETM
jgi:hypothetical protein